MSSGKDIVALIEVGKTGKSRFEDDLEHSFGHVKFVIHIRHPSMGVQYCFMVFLEIMVLKQCTHCSENVTFVNILIFNMFCLGKILIFWRGRNYLTVFWLCCQS